MGIIGRITYDGRRISAGTNKTLLRSFGSIRRRIAEAGRQV